MKWGRTLFLIGVLVVASIYFYLFEMGREGERQQAEERKKQEEWRRIQIFPYRPQDFALIKLTMGERVIVYQREEDTWWMKRPLAIRGPKNAADDIVKSIINVVETDPVAERPADLAQFGLDLPAITITVMLKGKQAGKTLYLGNDNPTSIMLYAKLEGSPRVFMVGSLIRWEIQKEFYNLTHRQGPFFPE
jgi:hypothetical protein